MENNESILTDDHPDATGMDADFHPFDFENLDSRIHADTGPDTGQHTANAYREAGRAFVAFYDQVLNYLLTCDNPRLAAYVVAMASGRSLLTGGISQKELGDRLGLSKAAVSKAIKTFQASFGNRIAGIEPMPGQRAIESCRRFATVRNHQLIKK